MTHTYTNAHTHTHTLTHSHTHSSSRTPDKATPEGMTAPHLAVAPKTECEYTRINSLASTAETGPLCSYGG